MLIEQCILHFTNNLTRLMTFPIVVTIVDALIQITYHMNCTRSILTGKDVVRRVIAVATKMGDSKHASFNKQVRNHILIELKLHCTHFPCLCSAENVKL